MPVDTADQPIFGGRKFLEKTAVSLERRKSTRNGRSFSVLNDPNASYRCPEAIGTECIVAFQVGRIFTDFRGRIIGPGDHNDELRVEFDDDDILSIPERKIKLVSEFSESHLDQRSGSESERRGCSKNLSQNECRCEILSCCDSNISEHCSAAIVQDEVNELLHESSTVEDVDRDRLLLINDSVALNLMRSAGTRRRVSARTSGWPTRPPSADENRLCSVDFIIDGKIVAFSGRVVGNGAQSNELAIKFDDGDLLSIHRRSVRFATVQVEASGADLHRFRIIAFKTSMIVGMSFTVSCEVTLCDRAQGLRVTRMSPQARVMISGRSMLRFEAAIRTCAGTSPC